jgi:hypothetical protein
MVADVTALRREHAALKLVIDGLVSIIRARAACNLGTLFRMARDAREAANALASAIERLLFPPVVLAEPPRTVRGMLTHTLDRLSSHLLGGFARLCG